MRVAAVLSGVWPGEGDSVFEATPNITGQEVRRFGRGVLLEPMETDVNDIKAIFTEIDRLGGSDFLPEGRPEQPPMPLARATFDD